MSQASGVFVSTCRGADSERACAAAAPRCRTIMIPELKRIASASGFGSMLGLGGGPGERPRNSDGAGPSRPEDEDEEDESHEKTATTNLISAGHESFELIFMMLMGIRTSVGRFCAQAPDARELAPSDFEQQWEGDFLSKGSAETPAHGHVDFRFKDYAPVSYTHLTLPTIYSV